MIDLIVVTRLTSQAFVVYDVHGDGSMVHVTLEVPEERSLA